MRQDSRLAGRPAVMLGVGIVVLELAAAVSTLVATTLLPVVADDLEAGDRLGVLVAGSSVGLFVALPLASRLLRSLGGPAVLGAGLLLTLVGAVATATATGPAAFATGRAVAGFAGGLLAVFGLSAAITHLEERVRLRVIAASTAMWILPGLIGPTAAVGLEYLVGWRWSILLPVPLALIGRALVLWAAPLGRARSGAALPPLTRTLLMPLGVVGFIVLSESRAWTAAALALAAAAAGFMSLMPRGTARLRRGAPSALTALTLFGFGYFGATSLVTVALTSTLGASLMSAGWALGAASVAWAVVSLTLPWLRDRGIVPSPSLGLLVTAAGVLGMALLLLGHAEPWAAVSAWGLVGAGVGAAYPTLYLRATTPDADSDADGLASAVLTSETFGGLVGGTVGGVLVGALLGSGAGGDLGFPAVFALFGVAIAAAAIAASRSRLPRGTPARG